jgi:PhnB protein
MTMQINPYLFFDGNCEEAFKLYEKALGGKIVAMLPHEGTPAAEHTPAEWKKKILHARLEVGGEAIMGTDVPPASGANLGYQRPQGFSVSVTVKTKADAEKVFNELANGGTVTMPLSPTFWSVAFGMVTDKYGVPWMVNCEQTA